MLGRVVRAVFLLTLLAAAGVVVALFNVPEVFVPFVGQDAPLEAWHFLDDGRTLLLAQRLWAVPDGPFGRLDRLVRVDAESGARIGAPCIAHGRLAYRGPLRGGRLLVQDLDAIDEPDRGPELQVLLAATCQPEPALTAALAQATRDAAPLADASGILFTRRDGRTVVLAVPEGTVTVVEPQKGGRKEPARFDISPSSVSEASLGDRVYWLQGSPRAELRARDPQSRPVELAGDAPDFLYPRFLADASTRTALLGERLLLLQTRAALDADGQPIGLELQGVEPDGRVRWQHRLAAAGDYTLSTARLVSDRIVGAAFGPNAAAFVFAVDRATGAAVWQFDLPALLQGP